MAEFKAKGYLEKTNLDREGGKHVTFEFSAKDALELAKLELMGRDLTNHLPILLEVRIKQYDKAQGSKGFIEKRGAGKILNSRELTKKDKRVF